MFTLKGIHHLAMATRDMEKTIRFWRDLLGMRLVGGLGKKGYKLYFFEISPQNYIVFFEWSAGWLADGFSPGGRRYRCSHEADT